MDIKADTLVAYVADELNFQSYDIYDLTLLGLNLSYSVEITLFCIEEIITSTATAAATPTPTPTTTTTAMAATTTTTATDMAATATAAATVVILLHGSISER